MAPGRPHEWYDADPSRRAVDERMNDLLDALISTYRPRPPTR
ncbi:hypothetical protein [Rathayibacter iranicus]|nr:hypothetical protein [Rathayibacter iranicus]